MPAGSDLRSFPYLRPNEAASLAITKIPPATSPPTSGIDRHIQSHPYLAGITPRLARPIQLGDRGGSERVV